MQHFDHRETGNRILANECPKFVRSEGKSQVQCGLSGGERLSESRFHMTNTQPPVTLPGWH
jgi:hypothetical protein